MNTTHEERKEKAMEYLANLDIHKPYIRGFKEENNVCYFENFAGFWAWQDEELMAKIKEIVNNDGDRNNKYANKTTLSLRHGGTFENKRRLSA